MLRHIVVLVVCVFMAATAAIAGAIHTAAAAGDEKPAPTVFDLSEEPPEAKEGDR